MRTLQSLWASTPFRLFVILLCIGDMAAAMIWLKGQGTPTFDSASGHTDAFGMCGKGGVNCATVYVTANDRVIYWLLLTPVFLVIIFGLATGVFRLWRRLAGRAQK
jgi:hypothetical protein